MKKRLLALSLSVLLTACSNPMDATLPQDSAKLEAELPALIKDLSPENKELLIGYLMRAKIQEAFHKDNSLMVGVTVQQAIDAQKKFLEERALQQKAEEALKAAQAAEAQALKEKLEAERSHILKSINEAVTVTLLDKQQLLKDFSAKRYIDAQMITVGIENKSSNTIIGIDGVIEFIDVFDNTVGGIGVKITASIKPNETYQWKGSRNFDYFDKQETAIWNLEEGKYTSRFIPRALVFEDGTKLEMPK